MYELAHQNFFEENFDLLASIFSEKGMPKVDHLELSKGHVHVQMSKFMLIYLPHCSY